MLAPRKKLWSTPTVAIDLAIDMACIKKNDVCYDIGCGEGQFLIRCCQRTGARCIGIEIDEIRAKQARENIRQAGLSEEETLVITGNALDMDYSQATATVFFLYLVSRGLRLIYPLLQQLDKPIRVVTYMEPFPPLPPPPTTIISSDAARGGAGKEKNREEEEVRNDDDDGVMMRRPCLPPQPIQIEKAKPLHQPGAAWPLYLYHFHHHHDHHHPPSNASAIINNKKTEGGQEGEYQ